MTPLAKLREQLSGIASCKVLVWGVGSHGGGGALAQFFHNRGATVSLLDSKPPSALPEAAALASQYGWAWHCGDATHPQLKHVDLVVCSPAIPPRAITQAGVPVVVAEALFYALHSGPRVGITATKGKSSTATICGALLGWPVAGNSHRSVLEHLEHNGVQAPLVMELSSFQLWHLRDHQPRHTAAIIGKLDVDHLDWHPDIAHYHAAKRQLAAWADYCVQPQSDLRVRMVDGYFVSPQGERIAPRSALPLLGEHQAENACLALTVALHLGRNPATCAQALTTVRGLPHRVQVVARSGRLIAIDDSCATTPVAAIAALSVVEGPLVVIAGGSDKGSDPSALIEAWRLRGCQLVLIGATAEDLAVRCARAGIAHTCCNNMEQAVAAGLAALAGSGTLLLSPGYASFGLFRDYADRGVRFAAACQRQLGGL